MQIELSTPLSIAQLAKLRAGDNVAISGTIYTARDAAHKRMAELLQAGQPLPFALQGSCIYYAGPSPAKPGGVIGAIGPTTAGRMDATTPLLLQHGLAAMIGKGARSPEVLAAMQQAGAVYFGFIGGAAALAAAHVTASKIIAWEDLGSEAVRELTVQNLPVTVLADTVGGDLYKSGPAAYLASRKK
ncbi:Fe-S-containing hydro-lyase [Ruminococcaceae bacterium OttesenSCG-928-A16]|nr:Fe-S-containing hydro-lyase [Ruminococcaceae bacterium OttesenSCG-928-A16]